MPAWPTLYPLLLHYKRIPPFPHGKGEGSISRRDNHITNDIFPEGLKTRDLYEKFIIFI